MAKVGDIFELHFFDSNKKDALFKTCFLAKKFKFLNLIGH
jgi:hypothetical protein